MPGDLKPKDFPQLAAEYVAHWNRMFVLLEEELDQLRVLHTEIELREQYPHLFAEQRVTSNIVAKLMNAAAALGIAAGVKPDPESIFADIDVEAAAKRVAELLGDKQASTDAGALTVCGCCGSVIA